MNELERIAGNVIVCGFEGQTAPRQVRRWLDDEALAGVILFKRNIEGVEQAARLIETCVGRDPTNPTLVCVDQEGGRVCRFDPPVLRLPSMRSLGAAGDPSLTRTAARMLGRQLRSIGVNLDFAPVLDVDSNPDNPVIGDRAFSSSADEVGVQGLAFAEGLMEGGVLPCGKHFPGHGDTDVDSHFGLPRLAHGRRRLDEVELVPFRAAVGRLPSLMTAHVLFEAVDPEVPATLSRLAVSELLRTEIGFSGTVFSDDLEMGAISASYSIEDAGVLAIKAGCDLLLVCSDLDAVARLREALARAAQSSEGFCELLRQASSRANTLRQAITSLPSPRARSAVLGSPEARRLEARLAETLQ